MVLPVEVLTVQAEPLALSSELPGRIEPVRVAEVRARVAGIVVRKRFEEGADVKAGDLLFQIDPAPLKLRCRAPRVSWRGTARCCSRRRRGCVATSRW